MLRRARRLTGDVPFHEDGEREHGAVWAAGEAYGDVPPPEPYDVPPPEPYDVPPPAAAQGEPPPAAQGEPPPQVWDSGAAPPHQ